MVKINLRWLRPKSMACVFAMNFCSVCTSKYGCAHSYAHICRACTNSVYTLIVDVCLSHTHILFQGFVAGSHPSFCLPQTLALRNTRLISNSFLEPLHSNYQRRAGEKASSRDQHTLPFGAPRNISNQGENHFQLAYHQLHLPWLPARPLVWHFRK